MAKYGVLPSELRQVLQSYGVRVARRMRDAFLSIVIPYFFLASLVRTFSS